VGAVSYIPLPGGVKMVVFATNFDTVHRRCCRKRDEERDFSEFDKLEQSELWQRVYKELREQFAFTSNWWVPDEVELCENGMCHVNVRFCHMDDRFDDDKHQFSTYRFKFCEPEEVAEKAQAERSILGV
jgi:hypothetical protein